MLRNGLLPGIITGMVMKLTVSSKIEAIEAEIRVKDMTRLNEAFLTNSVLEIMPLVAIRDKTGNTYSIGSGRPGEITRRLMSTYQKMVERETG